MVVFAALILALASGPRIGVPFRPGASLSADGGVVAVRDGDAIQLWDTTGWRLRSNRILPGGRPGLSPDGKTLAFVDGKGQLELCDAESGAVLAQWPSSITDDAPHFSHDGKRLVVTDTEGRFRMTDLTGKVAYGLLDGPIAFANSAFVQLSAGTLAVSDLETGKETSSFGENLVEPIAISPDGGACAALQREGEGVYAVTLWDVATGKLRWKQDGPWDKLLGGALRFEASLVGIGDVEARFDLTSGKVSAQSEPEDKGVLLANGASALAFRQLPDDGEVVTIRLADGVETRAEASFFDSAKVDGLKLSPSGRYLVTFESPDPKRHRVGSQPAVRVWDVVASRMTLFLKGFYDDATFSRDESQVLLASAGSVRSYQSANGELIEEVLRVPRVTGYTDVHPTPDGQNILVAQTKAGEVGDIFIRVARLERAELVSLHKTYPLSTLWPVISPNGKRAANVTFQTRKRDITALDIWNLERVTWVTCDPAGGKRCLTVPEAIFSPDSARVLTVAQVEIGGQTSTLLRLWHTESGDLVWERTLPNDPPSALAVSSDNQSIAIGGPKGVLLISLSGNVPDRQVATIKPAKLCFNGDNTALFLSPATPGPVVLLRVADGEIIQRLWPLTRQQLPVPDWATQDAAGHYLGSPNVVH